jgi:HlyD family secretion protein
VGLRTLDAAEILDGLSAGEVVLVGPAPPPGQRVRIDHAAHVTARAGTGTKEDAAAALSSAMGR